jgi:hypothetical protein
MGERNSIISKLKRGKPLTISFILTDFSIKKQFLKARGIDDVQNLLFGDNFKDL